MVGSSLFWTQSLDWTQYSREPAGSWWSPCGGSCGAAVGDLLHLGIPQVAAVEAEHRQEDPGFALLLDHRDQRGPVGDADVEVAVGGQDDPVDPVRDEVLLGGCEGQFDACATVGGAA